MTWPRQAAAQRTTVTDKQLQTNTQGQQYKYMKHAYTYETIDSHHKLFFYLFCFIEVTEVTDRRCCSKRNVLFNYALCSVMQATSLQLNNVFVQFWVLCANLCSVMQAPSITLNTKLYKSDLIGWRVVWDMLYMFHCWQQLSYFLNLIYNFCKVSIYSIK